MPSSSSIRPLLFTSVAESVYNEIISRSGRYYYFLGKVLSWPNELAPPKALESVFYEKDSRRNIILVKEVRPGDVALVADRTTWQSNVIYDMYDDRYSDEVVGIDILAGGSSYSSNTYITISGGGGNGAAANLVIDSGVITGVVMHENGYDYTNTPNVTITDPDNFGSGANVVAVLNTAYSGANSLANANFYVLTEELNIYKCLDNNGNKPSTVKPVDVTVDPFTTSDGYKWKFIGSVSPSLRNKFLTDDQMPVVSPLTKNFYSNGEIKNIIILNNGDNYTSATLSVDGDGYLESDPFLIVSAAVTNAGNGYSTANIVVDPPIPYSTQWTTSNIFYTGTQLIHNNNIYRVTVTGTTGISPPVHTVGDVINGAATLRYLGTVATGTPTITSGNISAIQFFGLVSGIQITSGGTGYTQPPDITISGGGGTGAAAYSTLNNGSLSKVILTNLGTNYTSAPTVTIGTGWTANARTALNDQVYYSTSLYTVVSANANYRVTDSKYDYISGNLSNSFTTVTGIALSNTGSDLFIVGSNTNTIAQFTLTTPYKVSTLVSNGNISVGSYDTSPQDLSFSNTGNIMFVLGAQNDKIYRFNLANTWNVLSATYVSNLSVSAYETNPTALFVDNSGTRLYVTGTTSDNVQSFTMTTPWDIANAIPGSNISIAGFEANVTGLSFNSTGRIMTLVGSNSDSLNQFYLSNAWDVSSATYFETFPVDNFDKEPAGIHYSEVAEKLYVLGANTKTVYQFTLPSSVFFGSSAPVHISGNVYNGDALLAYAGTAATGAATLKYGSGYTKEPNIVIYGDGANATAEVTVQKSEAKLTPVISGGKIINVIVNDGGIGYTNATINITGDGANASLAVNLSEGDIQTLQGNNELLAVEGTIDAIKVISGGFNYSAANVTITGDGLGANATATVSGGRVVKINVNSAGSGYTFANVIIQGDGNGASARAIIPPEGGHGSDIVSELYARSLAMYTTIAGEKNQGFNVTNDYRQVGLIKDIKSQDGEMFFSKITGSGCHVLGGNTSSVLIVDDAILVSSRNARYQVVAKTNNSVLVTSLDKIEPIIGDIMSINGSQIFTVTSVVVPDVDKYSGKLLFIDNREAFTTSGQFVSIKTVFKY